MLHSFNSLHFYNLNNQIDKLKWIRDTLAVLRDFIVELSYTAYFVIGGWVREALDSHKSLIDNELTHCTMEALSEVNLSEGERRTRNVCLMYIPIHYSQEMALIDWVHGDSDH